MDTGTAGTWFDAFIKEPVQASLKEFFAFIPKLLGAIVVLLLGWWIAKAIEAIIVRVLKTIAIDKLADQIQLSNVLVKGGIKPKLSELLGAIIYWIIMLAVVVIAFNVLELEIAAQLFAKLVEFLPSVISAVFILILGVFAAAFVGTTVRTAASNAGMLQASLLGEVVQTIIVVFAIVTALQQFKIEFLGDAFLILLGGISLGCAIAFGLGCKDLAGRWAADIVEQVQGRKR